MSEKKKLKITFKQKLSLEVTLNDDFIEHFFQDASSAEDLAAHLTLCL